MHDGVFATIEYSDLLLPAAISIINTFSRFECLVCVKEHWATIVTLPWPWLLLQRKITFRPSYFFSVKWDIDNKFLPSFSTILMLDTTPF